MLILTRRNQEKIKIGNDIELIICGFKPGQVKIGITAPRDIKVIRTELIERDKKKKETPVITVKKSRIKKLVNCMR